LAQGGGFFGDATARLGGIRFRAAGVVAMDFDRDGEVDVVVAQSGIASACAGITLANGLVLLKNTGPLPWPAVPVPQTSGWNVVSIAGGDADGDGWPDVSAITEYGTQIVFLGGPGGSFVPTPPAPAGYPVVGVTFVDLDADGRDEIVLQSATGIHVRRVSA